MEFKLKTCLATMLLLICIAGCYGQNKNLLPARDALKKWGIAYCISEMHKDTRTDTLASSSMAGYFENGSHSEKAYDTIKSFIKEYINSPQYQGKNNADLSLMKCLDLINNKEYDQKIKDCDKWIIKN